LPRYFLAKGYKNLHYDHVDQSTIDRLYSSRDND
jgi:hypothetical protein